MIRQIYCPYCNKEANIIDSIELYGTSYGNLWICRPCDAYVGCHRSGDGEAPLGTLANAELRMWRKKAHLAFDPKWKSGKMKRREAYDMLAQWMGIHKKKAHIAKMDIKQCKIVINLSNMNETNSVT